MAKEYHVILFSISRLDGGCKSRLPGFSNCRSAGEILEGATIKITLTQSAKMPNIAKRLNRKKTELNRTKHNPFLLPQSDEYGPLFGRAIAGGEE